MFKLLIVIAKINALPKVSVVAPAFKAGTEI